MCYIILLKKTSSLSYFLGFYRFFLILNEIVKNRLGNPFPPQSGNEKPSEKPQFLDGFINPRHHIPD